MAIVSFIKNYNILNNRENVTITDFYIPLKNSVITFILIIFFNSIGVLLNIFTRILTIFTLLSIPIVLMVFMISIKRNLIKLDSISVSKRYKAKKISFTVVVLTIVLGLSSTIILNGMSSTFFNKGYKCKNEEEFIQILSENKPYNIYDSSSGMYIGGTPFSFKLILKPNEVRINTDYVTLKTSEGLKNIEWKNTEILSVIPKTLTVYRNERIKAGTDKMESISDMIKISMYSIVIVIVLINLYIRRKYPLKLSDCLV